MDKDANDSLEELANLLYLARATLADKEKADAYLALAENVVQATASAPCDKASSA